MNIESHSLLPALDASALISKLGPGVALPESAIPSTTYSGVGRLIVPTVRTTAQKGSALPLRALLLAAKPCASVIVTYKPMGAHDDAAATVTLPNVGRQVYQGTIPAHTADFEYYVSATCGVEKLVFPAGAPTIMQTVVVM